MTNAVTDKATSGTDLSDNQGKPLLSSKEIILVGNPNVGKSVIFGLLTGQYVVVSNYPGTTVEIARGKMKKGREETTVVDTPGVLSLIPMSGDEIVTRDILLDQNNKIVLQVADAKNLQRTLLISLELSEMGIPFTIALNMSDEARERRIYTDTCRLSKILGVDLTETIAVSRTGIDNLKKNLENPKKSQYMFKYPHEIETAIDEISKILPPFSVSPRSVALMILVEDTSLDAKLNKLLAREDIVKINDIIRRTREKFQEPLIYLINKEKIKIVNAILKEVQRKEPSISKGILNSIGKVSMHPVWGIPVALLVLVLMYYFVGKLAAGVAVDFMNSVLFEKYINPWVTAIITKTIPVPLLQDLLVGEYGLITVALSYSFAIVLPVVTAFFLFFSILEDSGYLPRLAITTNKLCSYAGLNGKAILPMILGLGCGTMATISARILDSKKERMVAILLLALGVPCSAQLGVIMGVMAGLKSYAFFIWLFIILSSILIVGFLANRVLPGDNSDFILEIPPLRIPAMGNIFIKTFSRMEWYLKEAVPLFIVATFTLFLLDKFHILALIRDIASPVVVTLLGLPPQVTDILLMGFLRRDYGAAGLYMLVEKGLLTPHQMLVALVTITLFIPCIAQFFVIVKEKGIKFALLVGLFVAIFSVTAGSILNFLLTSLKIML